MPQSEDRLNGKWRTLAEAGVCYGLFNRLRKDKFMQEGIHYKWYAKDRLGRPHRPYILINIKIVTPEWIQKHKYLKPDHLSPMELKNIIGALGFIPDYLHAECERAGMV